MSAAELSFRQATADDLPDVVRLLADDPLGGGREAQADALNEAYVAAFDEIDRDPNNELIVVEQAGRVVGCLQLTFIANLTYTGGKRLQIEGVRIDQSLRGQGAGEALFLWAIERGRDRGCRLVQLTSNKSRAHAIRFYERLGFSTSHEGLKLDLSE